ncbi:MAG: deoxyguanosinetriphosphate triphosphohydrolase, partial [Sulfuricella sp.]
LTQLYRHYRVMRIIRELFLAFLDDIRLLLPQFQEKAELDKPRAIADYIAGMTDRVNAIRECRRLFAIELE